MTCVGSDELGWFCSHECTALPECEEPATGCSPDLGAVLESWCAIGCFAVVCPDGWTCETLELTDVCFPA